MRARFNEIVRDCLNAMQHCDDAVVWAKTYHEGVAYGTTPLLVHRNANGEIWVVTEAGHAMKIEETE